ncbi:MAG TPA: amino acid ABC transporter substrate-binding protein [Vicinamibacterales bacterium]|nr:amino acid ABC transporter substrate-binding protein [Vicinamibacterales bacterium]
MFRLFVVLFAVGIAGCGGPATPAVLNEIILGATLPLTGKESRAGLYFKNGYTLAVDEINAAGGVMIQSVGRKLPIKLEIVDDKSDSMTAVQLAEHLITVRGIHALLGTYETKLVLAQSVVPERHKIPYVTGGGAASEIFKRDFKWVFGLLSSVEAMAATFMDWLAVEQDAGHLARPARIALAWENTAHGQDFRAGTEQRVAAHADRFTLVMNEAFELNSKDFTPLMLKLKAATADVFMSDTHYPDFVLQHKTYLQMGLTHPVVAYGPRGTEADARATLGDGVNYLVSGQWWTQELPYPESRAFVKNYTAKYGDVSSYYPGLAYETARTMIAAIQTAGTIEREPVRQALAAMDRDGAILPGRRVYFPAKTGNQIDNPSVLVQNMPGGTFRIVYPPDAATGAALVPPPR